MTVAGCIAAFLTISAWAAGSVQWHEDFAAAKHAAANTGRPIVAVFHSSGCGPCERMEDETLADPEVAGVIAERFEPVRVSAIHRHDLATAYLVSFYPTVKFLDAGGVVVHDTQGFVEASEFVGVMKRALDAHAALLRARSAADAEEGPEDAEGALAIARDFHAARQHEHAARWAREAVELADKTDVIQGEAQYILGAALTDAGEPGQAQQPLVNALKVADGTRWQWDARLKLGYVWLQRGKDDSAIGLLQTVYASEEASGELRAEARHLLRWWDVDVD
ncbi:MAG: thioredoxin family protein [Armatimonadota bacterium]